MSVKSLQKNTKLLFISGELKNNHFTSITGCDTRNLKKYLIVKKQIKKHRFQFVVRTGQISVKVYPVLNTRWHNNSRNSPNETGSAGETGNKRVCVCFFFLNRFHKLCNNFTILLSFSCELNRKYS